MSMEAKQCHNQLWTAAAIHYQFSRVTKTQGR